MSLEARNLLLSVLLRPQVVPNEVGVLSLLGAVAVAEAIEAVTPLTVTVKWPNDVLVRGKKCCGMLLESSLSGGDIPPDYVIMGIGLNVNQDRFDQLASPNATSLLLEIGRPVERQVVLDALMDRLSSRYRTLVATGANVVRNEYLKRLEGLGCELNFRQTQSGAVVPAVIEDVTTSGSVVVRLRDGTQMTLSAGEITTRETESHNTTDGVADDMRD